MTDLRSRAEAFLRGPCILGEHWHLVYRYVEGELWEDPEALNLLSICLQTAQTEATRLEGATPGPARDAQYFYQRAAGLLKDIQAEVSAVRQ
jgi:hypothetical protein